MQPNHKLILLLLVVSTTVGKYVYIKEYSYWTEAQIHCRTHYTDLAPISSKSDTKLLKQLANHNQGFIWFGMVKNTSDPDKWMWSGGGEVTTFFWDIGQPNLRQSEMYGILYNYKWHDAPDWLATFFFCYSVHVVREEKTWDEALQHCRENHTDLASISSETEMMLIHTELSKDVTTEHVWMGLHFLSGAWLWVDGQTAEFEAWGQGGTPECPEEHLSCGALVDNSGGLKVKAHNCRERLHFICY